MPIYAYECRDCGVRFERRQGFNDMALTDCPECEGNVHRLIQPAGVIFKGSGFYVTDNRGSRKNLTSSGKSETSSETKSESKPAAESKAASPSD